MNKKILLIIIGIMLLSISVCSAADRWQWVTSDDKFGIFFDTQTIKYDTDKNHVIVFERQVLNDDGRQWLFNYTKGEWAHSVSFRIIKTEYNLTNNTMKLLSLYDYKSDNTILHSYSYKNAQYVDIVPSTMAERSLNAIKLYIKEHDSEIKYIN